MTGIVIAGGQSRRMGRPKALISWRGEPLISYPLRLLDGLFNEVIISSRSGEDYAGMGHPVHGDRYEGSGALVGLASGLAAAGEPLAFVVACDMPFVSEEVARLILSILDEKTWAVVPEGPRGPEPLLALYAKRCLPTMEKLIASGDLRVRSLFDLVPVTVIPQERIREADPMFRSFVNVNTPEDLSGIEEDSGEEGTGGP